MHHHQATDPYKMNVPTDPLHLELCDLGIVCWPEVGSFHPRTRDCEDVGVLRCRHSGVIFLDSSSHVTRDTYAGKTGTSYWSASSRADALRGTREDDMRRADHIRPLVAGRRWLDVGCGLGGTLELLKDTTSAARAVEPQKEIRDALEAVAIPTWPSLESACASQQTFDVITLFHVFEHLTEPLKSLREIHSLLVPGGLVLIEVPHARDALIDLYCVEQFRAHTLWSEHLVLHTRDSLRRYLEEAGFTNCSVTGFQRYPWANHIGWLQDGKPGGHVRRPELRTPALDEAYASMLSGMDRTDTLIAIARKPKNE